MLKSTARAGGHLMPRPAAAERRAAVRYPSQLRGSCQTVHASEGEPWTAHVRDVSAGGIGLVLRRRFEPGTLLAVEPLDAAPAAPLVLLAKVVHATRQDGGLWLLGCEFVTELSDDQLRALR